MVRTLIALAVLLFAAATLAPSTALACISCNYTPEVVHTPVPGAKKAAPKRAARERSAPAPKRRYVKPRQPEPVQEAAKPAPPPPEEPLSKPTSTAKSGTEGAEPEAGTESSSVSTAKLDGGNGASDANEPAPHSDPSAEEPPQRLDCKRFSPTAGTVVPAPCS